MKCKNCGQELSLASFGHGFPGEPRAYLSWAYGCLVPVLAVVVLIAELFLESPRSVELLTGLFCLFLVWIVLGKSIDAARWHNRRDDSYMRDGQRHKRPGTGVYCLECGTRTRVWPWSSYDDTIANHRQEDIEVLIPHPHGDHWVPLDEWISSGPGPRPLLSPTDARDKNTEQSLPLDVIPMRYRNTEESRRLIEKGQLYNPWPEHDDEEPEGEATRGRS